MLCCAFESHAIELNGKYLSQSGELLFRFKGDSLYIDIAQSQRTISAFKLVKNTETKKSTTYNAYESYLENDRVTYREVLIRVTKLKSKKYVLEYTPAAIGTQVPMCGDKQDLGLGIKGWSVGEGR